MSCSMLAAHSCAALAAPRARSSTKAAALRAPRLATPLRRASRPAARAHQRNVVALLGGEGDDERPKITRDNEKEFWKSEGEKQGKSPLQVSAGADLHVLLSARIRGSFVQYTGK